LLISNHKQWVDKFEILQDQVIDEGIGNLHSDKKVFMPVAVKQVFLGWLKEYPDTNWKPKKNPSGFKPSVAGELQVFFQQLKIEEEWEETIMNLGNTPSLPIGDKNTPAPPKYIVPMVLVIIVMLFLLELLLSLKSIEDIKNAQGKVRDAKVTPTQIVLPQIVLPQIDSEIIEKIGKAKGAIDELWITTKRGSKNGSALEITQEIWNTPNRSPQLEEEVKHLLRGMLNKYKTEPRLSSSKYCGLKEISEFSKEKPMLLEIKKEIDEKDVAKCSSTSPTPTMK
jgi:hypothetical protein